LTNYPGTFEAAKYKAKIKFNCPNCGKEAKRIFPGNASDDLWDWPHNCVCGAQLLLGFDKDQKITFYWFKEDVGKKTGDPELDTPDEDDW